MKNYLSVPLAAVLLLTTMFTVGCNGSELDQARAQNRAAMASLSAANDALAAARANSQMLQSQLDAANAALAVKDKQIALLEKKVAELEALVAKMGTPEGRVPVKGPDFSPIPSSVSDAIKKWAEANSTWVIYDPATGMVKFKSDMTFAPGSDIVNDKAKQALAEFTKILNMPEAMPFHIYVAGHTDDMPISKPDTKKIHPNNWYLSVHRAVAVEEVMEGAGLAPERAGAMGFGPYHPVAENAAGHKGNELNRRVEVWIIPQERFLTIDGATIEPAPMPKATTPKATTPRTAVPAGTTPKVESTATPGPVSD